MKLFIDANILVAVLNKEYPAFDCCARVLSLAGRPGFKLACSSLSLGIAFYFCEKKNGRTEALRRIRKLTDYIAISPCGENEVKAAFEYKNVDFEDAMQEASAKSGKSDLIITLDHSDFWFSKIPVWHPEDFLLRYLPEFNKKTYAADKQ